MDQAVNVMLKRPIRSLHRAWINRLTPNETLVEVSEHRARFLTDTYPQYRVVKTIRTVEYPVIERLITELRPDDVVWDVGACVGTFSCLLADGLQSGIVIAFEPLPVNAEQLEKHVELNDSRVLVREVALSNERDSVTLSVQNSVLAGTQQATIDNGYADPSSIVSQIEVDTVRGDDVSGVPRPTVLKIDVEGVGVSVLEGMRELLSSEGERPRVILIEPHGNLREILTCLRDFGYSTEFVGREPGERAPRGVLGLSE